MDINEVMFTFDQTIDRLEEERLDAIHKDNNKDKADGFLQAQQIVRAGRETIEELFEESDQKMVHKLYYIDQLGAFFRIVDINENLEIQYLPASSGTPNCSPRDWDTIGYMGNPHPDLDSVEEAEAFLNGMKFESDFV